jgi:hypothetical protein
MIGSLLENRPAAGSKCLRRIVDQLRPKDPSFWKPFRLAEL